MLIFLKCRLTDALEVLYLVLIKGSNTYGVTSKYMAQIQGTYTWPSALLLISLGIVFAPLLIHCIGLLPLYNIKA